MKIIIIVCSLLILIGCKSTKTINKNISQNIALLAIGKSKSNIGNITFRTASNAVIEKPIRVGITQKVFTKSTFKKYQSQLKSIGKVTSERYVDSLLMKPIYFELELLDKVMFVEELNKKQNRALFDYLTKTEEVVFVSNISLVFSKENANIFHEGDEFYVETSENKKMTIQAFKSDVEIGSLNVSLDHVLNYQLSKFCWGKGESDTPVIYDVLLEKENCSEGTYRNANQILPKTYDFKNY